MNINIDRWSSAAFRILSEKKSISDICNILNTQPTRFYLKGDSYSKRNPKSKIFEENVWILESELGDQEPLEAHIEYFLLFLKKNEDSIKNLQTECEFAIMCAYSSESGQGGFTLNHEILREITMFPVDLSINLYPPEK